MSLLFEGCFYQLTIPQLLVLSLVEEVKDRNSLGLMDRSKFFGKNIFSRNCEKIRSATRAGFTIKLVLVAGKTVKTLPKGWYKLDKEKVKQIAM